MTYNTTEYDAASSIERNVFDRKNLSTYLRWSHVLKHVKAGSSVLDVGCGERAGLCEVLYRNRMQPKSYLGVDFSAESVGACEERWAHLPWARFVQADACALSDCEEVASERPWDVVACFETIEHVGRSRVGDAIEALASAMGHRSVLLLSTPVLDFAAGVLHYHVVGDEVGELSLDEMRAAIESRFYVEGCYGTRINLSAYEKLMTDEDRSLFKSLSEYYDTTVMSCLMAPLFTDRAKNVLWRCALTGNRAPMPKLDRSGRMSLPEKTVRTFDAFGEALAEVRTKGGFRLYARRSGEWVAIGDRPKKFKRRDVQEALAAPSEPPVKGDEQDSEADDEPTTSA